MRPRPKCMRAATAALTIWRAPISEPGDSSLRSNAGAILSARATGAHAAPPPFASSSKEKMEAKPPPTAKQRDKIPPPHVGHRDFLPPALRRDNPSGRFTAPFSLPQADRQ